MLHLMQLFGSWMSVCEALVRIGVEYNFFVLDNLIKIYKLLLEGGIHVFTLFAETQIQGNF